jgi:pimeloyl-ACP methyl ester carboxylesterase
MAVRVNDLVFIFNGGFPFSQQFPVANDFDFGPYNAAKAKLSHTRDAKADSRGADNNINANVDTVMATIRGFTKNRLDTIGQVVLLGRSNGCALALALAAELNGQGITDLTFVGLSDVPMWDSGRTPTVRNVGDFKPINNPLSSGAVGPNPGIGGFLSVGPVPQNEIPFYKLPREIKARNKVTGSADYSAV